MEDVSLIFLGGGTKNLKVGFRVTLTLKKTENQISGHPRIFNVPPPEKLKVGFQVRATLGNVHPHPSGKKTLVWIKATLDYVRPLDNVSPCPATQQKIFFLIFGSK